MAPEERAPNLFRLFPHLVSSHAITVADVASAKLLANYKSDISSSLQITLLFIPAQAINKTLMEH